MNNFDTTVNALLTDDFKSAAAAGLIGLGALTGGSANATPEPKPSITQTRGVRNNNPGNIEKGIKWGGATGDDGRFIIFDSPEMGIRAIGRILRTYSRKYGINTVSGIVSRWAPPNENDTENYIKNVSTWTGFAPDKKLNVQDPGTMFKLINAIIRQENSTSYQPDVVNRAIGLIDKNY